ncbi:hypothetical protein F0562_019342 [Nyssa sinensis]|uniref:Fungal lipase-type domain-containing protein n=1 Tax=Nyssa sinensis TaxID=561372 RepID=A0A5J4ZBR3_9ASTE|nr:hypothetical protein F0562_019342 [Nyssa sinensis]
MACNLVPISGNSVAAATNDTVKEHKSLGRSFSGKELCGRAKIRRSYSDNHLCYSVNRIRDSAIEAKLKNSPSIRIFNFHLPGSIFPNPLRSFLFDRVMSKGINIEETSLEISDEISKMEMEKKERVNWVERWLFFATWHYAITEIKAEDLRRYFSLDLVTSSLTKKAHAAELRAKLDQDSTRVPVATSAAIEEKTKNLEHKRLIRPSVAYEIAASAASYVLSRANDLLSLGPEPQQGGDGSDSDSRSNKNNLKEEEESPPSRMYKSEVAAYVAASTMTAVVAAAHVLAALSSRDQTHWHQWQANLFFDPTKFEGTEVLVHRGIYEAAKGIYEQFMPEIMEHLNRYGNRAKLKFTGHSLGEISFREHSPATTPIVFAQLLKRLSGSFRSHPCLNRNKLLYSPMGKIFILQPDQKSSPPHSFLPPGSAIYAVENGQCGSTKSALRAFLNTPHPLETLSDPTAYGSDGTILRDHDSSNYLKAVNGVIRQQTEMGVWKVRKQSSLLWPLLTSQSPHSWSHEHNLENNRLVNNEVMTGV